MDKVAKTKQEEYRTLYSGTKYKKGAKVVSKCLKLSNPVSELANKIMSLFALIKGVQTEFDMSKSTLWVYVNDPDKVEAYKFFLKRHHKIGNLHLDVKLISTYQGTCEEVSAPTYKVKHDEMVRLFKLIFEGGVRVEYNSAVDITGTIWDFFEFPAVGITYQADSLANIAGIKTTLLEDAIMEVFDVFQDVAAFHISSYSVMR